MDPNELVRIVLDRYIEIFAKFFKRFDFLVDRSGISIKLKEASSIDERIAKIDEAKNSLLEGVRVIDELRDAAQKNKKEAELAIAQLNILQKDKANIQQELDTIRKIAESDVETFRKMAGVPSEADIRRERIVGFISGVVSSIVASALIWLIVWIIGLIL